MIRYTVRYTVDRETFDVLRRFRDDFGLNGRRRLSSDGPGLGFLDHSWGQSQIEDTERQFFLGDLQSEWHYPAPSGYQIVLGTEPRREFLANQDDIAENLQRIQDARRMADWVVVSIHGHEAGDTAEDPPEMFKTFAHTAIDAGADIVHGHGPHRDRGIEIYSGRPIFYSLGHFIVQNDTIERIPLDNILRQGTDKWESTPADFVESRGVPSRPGGLHSASAYFRDVVATVRFNGGQLNEIKLYPVKLGFRRPRSQRGRPVLAGKTAAREQLELLRRLSRPFGTEILIEDTVGYLRTAAPGSRW